MGLPQPSCLLCLLCFPRSLWPAGQHLPIKASFLTVIQPPENRASVSSELEKLPLWPDCELLVALEWGTNGSLMATLHLEGRFIQDLATLTGPKMVFPEHGCSQRPQLSEKSHSESEPGLGGQLDHAGPLGMDLLMF